MAGVNLLDAQALAKRQRIFGEIFSHDIVDIDAPAKSLVLHWCIEGRWKLIELNTSRYPDRKVQLRPKFMFTPDEVELYDLVADPYPVGLEAQVELGAVGRGEGHPVRALVVMPGQLLSLPRAQRNRDLIQP